MSEVNFLCQSQDRNILLITSQKRLRILYECCSPSAAKLLDLSSSGSLAISMSWNPGAILCRNDHTQVVKGSTCLDFSFECKRRENRSMATDLIAVASGRPSNSIRIIFWYFVVHHDIPPCVETRSEERRGSRTDDMTGRRDEMINKGGSKSESSRAPHLDQVRSRNVKRQRIYSYSSFPNP
jgi:hypothetical protein